MRTDDAGPRQANPPSAYMEESDEIDESARALYRL